MRTDTIQPAAGGVEAAAGLGMARREGKDWIKPYGGGQVVVGLGEKVAVAAATATHLGDDDDWYWATETRIALDQPDDDEPMGSLVLGLGGRISRHSDPRFAARVGAVGSIPFSYHFRPYAGLILEPELETSFSCHVMFGTGITWRPPLGEHLSLLVQAENTAAWYISSSNAERSGTGAGLLLGLTWER